MGAQLGHGTVAMHGDLVQFVALAGQFLGLLADAEKHLGLGFQDDRVDGLEDIVDGPGLVTAKAAGVVHLGGGDEDDGTPRVRSVDRISSASS